jgi:hypothetical protein
LECQTDNDAVVTGEICDDEGIFNQIVYDFCGRPIESDEGGGILGHNVDLKGF